MNGGVTILRWLWSRVSWEKEGKWKWMVNRETWVGLTLKRASNGLKENLTKDFLCFTYISIRPQLGSNPDSLEMTRTNNIIHHLTDIYRHDLLSSVHPDEQVGLPSEQPKHTQTLLVWRDFLNNFSFTHEKCYLSERWCRWRNEISSQSRNGIVWEKISIHRPKYRIPIMYILP